MTDPKLSIAPMMDWTDRHYRGFMRLITRQTLLYTEMVTAPAVIHGDRARLLGYADGEHPIALQLGGSDPAQMAEAARIGADFGYDEININVGCPSDRVQSGAFGAVLMKDPDIVAQCFTAMQEAVSVPVTVKCRIGVDDQDPEVMLPEFLRVVANAGCKTFIIHARKAWLKGLSPKENRMVPPLRYDLVRFMKSEFPDLAISLNGGLENLDQAQAETEGLDGAMLGRAAYHDPWVFAQADTRVFGAPDDPARTRADVVRGLMVQADELLSGDGRLHDLTRHVLGLFAGQPGARHWRRVLSEEANRDGAGPEVIAKAAGMVGADV